MNKSQNYFDFIVGSIVLFTACFFIFFSAKNAKISKKSGYEIIAKFENGDGINVGSDVKISGVKIGSVNQQSLDEKTFQAKYTLNINENIKLPTDSSAKIVSEGLLGSKYITINPGGDDNNLNNVDEISFTQSSVNFEELLGKFIFSDKNEKK
jgi:phospholipid/cholesterol/gamma-HCH transport system substrate-binding protein